MIEADWPREISFGQKTKPSFATFSEIHFKESVFRNSVGVVSLSISNPINNREEDGKREFLRSG